MSKEAPSKNDKRASSGIERRYWEGFVAKRASREKQIQQHYRPLISVHKWFARRPGSLFRAVLLAEFVEAPLSASFERGHQLDGVCLDPFMGGGTPLLEAARLGMSVIGFDTNPMARWIVERELEDVDPDELARIGEQIAADVEAKVSDLYVTDCPRCGVEAAARYFVWVRQHVCQECNREHTLLADTEIVSTKLGRHPREVHVCPHCHALSEHKPGKRPKRCRDCGANYDSGLIPSETLLACACGSLFRIPPHGTIEEPRLKLVAVEYDCAGCANTKGATRHTYKQPDAGDLARVARAQKLANEAPSPFLPDELIPQGVETARLMRWGYNRWCELFTERQLYGLGLLAARIDEHAEGPVKRALMTIFSDTLRYQNLLCRYDRQALKPTDIFAVHGFPVPRVACEVALLGERRIGSGGFRHGLEKYVRAKRWGRAPYEKTNAGRNRVTAPERIASTIVRSPAQATKTKNAAYLKRGSLKLEELAEASIDIVLTDPPYYANVQYGELMDFCYVWLRRLAPATPYFKRSTAKTADDAVGSGGDEAVDIVEFTDRLSTVFAAATRALKPGAPFCFTYHHNELDAYAPLVVACLNAGLVPTAVYACPSEMRSSTHIHQRNAATVDTLFVLRKPPVALGDEVAGDAGVRTHLAALRRVGLQPTDADRDCLRSGQLAVQAMRALEADWSAMDDPAELYALASATLHRLAGRRSPRADVGSRVAVRHYYA
jgi:adenine-specific DNA methylase